MVDPIALLTSCLVLLGEALKFGSGVPESLLGWSILGNCREARLEMSRIPSPLQAGPP